MEKSKWIRCIRLQLSSLYLSGIFYYWKAFIGSIVEKHMFTCLLKYAGCKWGCISVSQASPSALPSSVCRNWSDRGITQTYIYEGGKPLNSKCSLSLLVSCISKQFLHTNYILATHCHYISFYAVKAFIHQSHVFRALLSVLKSSVNSQYSWEEAFLAVFQCHRAFWIFDVFVRTLL